MRHVAFIGALAAALTTSDASPVAAQTTFWACRVPAVGVLYMIADGAANCLDAAHVKFSWTDGGAPPDGSITTVKLADNAVTSAKIANGTIVAADLAPALVPGVEYGEDFTTLDPTNTATTAATLAVSHPGTGFIVATATAQVGCSATQLTSTGLTNGGTGTEGWSYYTPAPANGSFGYMVAQGTFPVTGAATANINYNVQLYGTDSCTYFKVTRFQAIFVPVRY